jgi:alkylhydroperoxidase family enzyme
MDATRALELAEGDLAGPSRDAGTAALIALARKTVLAPAGLVPDDLAPVVAAYGQRGALEIVSYVASFHFVNRIADLVGIRSDVPLVQRHWGGMRRLGVRLQGWAMGQFLDLSNRDANVDAAAALAEAEAVLGRFPPGYGELVKAPNVAAFLTTVADVVRRLPPDLVGRVAPVVAAALPATEEEATGFHARPTDPIDALAFVGTRYPARTTDAMTDAVRARYGMDDAALTDLFYAISMRNAFERMDRLLAAPLPPGPLDPPAA